MSKQVLEMMLIHRTINKHLMIQIKASNQIIHTSVRPITTTIQRPASSKFDQYLENQFPRFYEHYQVAIRGNVRNSILFLQLGGKWCWSDLKIYYRVRKALWKKEITEADLSVPELLVLIQVIFALLIKNIKNIAPHIKVSKRAGASNHTFIFASISHHWRSHHCNWVSIKYGSLSDIHI